MNHGLHCLNWKIQDDFGNLIVPFVSTCVDDFGRLRGFWRFDQINFGARYHFYTSI